MRKWSNNYELKGSELKIAILRSIRNIVKDTFRHYYKDIENNHKDNLQELFGINLKRR